MSGQIAFFNNYYLENGDETEFIWRGPGCDYTSVNDLIDPTNGFVGGACGRGDVFDHFRGNSKQISFKKQKNEF